MDIIIIGVAALLTSALTLFSGFGLGTLLMPIVALFFPLELAIAMTALVIWPTICSRSACSEKRRTPAY